MNLLTAPGVKRPGWPGTEVITGCIPTGSWICWRIKRYSGRPVTQCLFIWTNRCRKRWNWSAGQGCGIGIWTSDEGVRAGIFINRRYTRMNADECQTLLATDPHRHTRTILFFCPNDLFVQKRLSLRYKKTKIILRHFLWVTTMILHCYWWIGFIPRSGMTIFCLASRQTKS